MIEIYPSVNSIGPVTMDNPDSEFLDLGIDWGNNICHWLIDVLPVALFALNYDPSFRSKTVLLKLDALTRFHGRQYLKLLGFTKWKLKENESNPTRVINPICHSSHVHPFIVESLRRLIPEAIAAYPMDARMNLLIQRSLSGCENSESRNFSNRETIMERFAEVGLPLTMVYLEGLPVLQQIAMFAQAQIIIGAHGAGLVNIMFCRKDCRFIEVKSPHFWNGSYAEIAGQIGLRYFATTGILVNQDPLHPLYRYGLSVCPENLLELLK